MAKPSTLLDDLVRMSDKNIELFFEAFSQGMHDEWDCTPAQGLSMFGAAELRIAAKAGAAYAEEFEEE